MSCLVDLHSSTPADRGVVHVTNHNYSSILPGPRRDSSKRLPQPDVGEAAAGNESTGRLRLPPRYIFNKIWPAAERPRCRNRDGIDSPVMCMAHSPYLHTVPLPLAYSIVCSADFPSRPPENSC